MKNVFFLLVLLCFGCQQVPVVKNSIKETKREYLKPQKWGYVTESTEVKGKLYIHPLNAKGNLITWENVPFKEIKKVYLLKTKKPLKCDFRNRTLIVNVEKPTKENPDPVVVLEIYITM